MAGAVAEAEIPGEWVVECLHGSAGDPVRLEERLAGLHGELLERMVAFWLAGRTPVLATSRGLWGGRDPAVSGPLGQALAGLMARIAADLPPQLGYLISKGGTTSQTLLTSGLDLASVRLEGQLLPGLSLLRLGPDHPRFPGLPLLTFPGNLGQAGCLHRAWHWMERGRALAVEEIA